MRLRTRLIATILCVVCIISLFPLSAFALNVDKIDLSEGTPNFRYKGYLHVGVTGEGLQSAGGVYTVLSVGSTETTLGSTVYDQIFGAGNGGSMATVINSYKALFEDENTTEKAVNGLMRDYGIVLAYLSWLGHNFWSNEDGSETYSAITLPLSTSGDIHPMDTDQLRAVMQDLDYMANKLLESEQVWPSESGTLANGIPIYVYPTKTLVVSNGFEDIWSTYENGGSSLENTPTFFGALRRLCQLHFEAGILYTIAKGEQEEHNLWAGEDIDNWDYATLVANVGDWDSPMWDYYEGNLDPVTNSETTTETPSETPTETPSETPSEIPTETPSEMEPATADENAVTASSTDAEKNAAIKNLYEKYKVSFDSYMSAFQEIYNIYTSLNTIAFPDVVVGDNTYYAWHRDWADTEYDVGDNEDNMTKWFSETFRAIWDGKIFINDKEGDESRQDQIFNINTENGIFGLLVREGSIVDGQIIIGTETAELTDIGYVILSAGAIYDPFVSVAGNDAWLATVYRFLKSQEQKDDITKILQVALNTKKPLYVTDGDNASWVQSDILPDIVAADYRYAFLEDVLQIEQDKTRAYVLMRGDMSPSQVDGSTWEYVNKDPTINKDNTVTGAHVEFEGDTIEDVAERKATEQLTGGGTGLDTSGINGSITSTGSGTVPSELRLSADATVAASNYQVTTPIMFTSGFKAKWFGGDATGFAAGVGGTTSLIIHNAMADTKDNSHIQNARTEQLFVNGLGDIVLVDGTVVLPAIANPVLYNYTSPPDEGAEDIYDNLLKNDSFQAYYPYTAALMNHYPAARISPDGRLTLEGGADENKYMFIVRHNTFEWNMTSLFAKKITDVTQGGDATLEQLASVRAAPFVPMSFCVEDDHTKSMSILNVAEGDIGTTWQNWLSLGLGRWDFGTTRSSTMVVTRGKGVSGEGMSFFPLNDSGVDVRDSYLNLAGPITNSALRYISDNDATTGAKVASGNFRIEAYITDFVGEGLLGTQYAATLVKNAQISYDQLVDDQSGRFLKFLIQIVDAACESLGKIDGVLSIKGPYDNAFFNTIFTFIQDLYLLIVVLLLVVTASRFFKGHFNMLYVCFIGLLCFAGFEVYANWMPTLVPQLYNFAVNDVVENVVWNTTFYNAERYQDTYRNADNVDPQTGKLQPYTGTITLYQLTNAEMREVANRMAVDYNELRKGTVVYLDADAGIFVQGNLVKMSVDRLLVNNSMRGLYKSQWELLGTDYTGTEELLLENIPAYNGNPYSIQLVQPTVSLEAYYTPFDHFERAFISQLNKFANYFIIERNMNPYGSKGELMKDAFMTNAYLYSGIFTAPGDDEVLKNSLVIDSITVDINDPSLIFTSYETQDLIADIQAAFVPQEDWLGITKVFGTNDGPVDAGVQNSIWGYIMQQRGWYDWDWNMTEYGDRKLSDMVRYVNNQTKAWVVQNLDNLTTMSDENAIKMIALYATTCYTHYVSEVGQWLYPNYLNAADIELKDVLYGSMVTLRDKHFAYDGTVVNTVGINLGVFGVIFLLFIILFSAIFIFLITYMIPLLYGSFGCIIIFKLVNSEDKMGVVKGYTKVTLASIILYFFFGLSLQLVSMTGYKWYSYLATAVCMFFCLYFLFWVLLSVVTDFGELGNNTLVRNLVRGMDKLTKNNFSKLTTNVAHITNRRRTNITPQIAYQYGRTYSVDDYDRPHGRRSTITHTSGDLTGPGRYGPRSDTAGYGRDDYYVDDVGRASSSRRNTTARPRRGWRSTINRR